MKTPIGQCSPFQITFPARYSKRAPCHTGIQHRSPTEPSRQRLQKPLRCDEKIQNRTSGSTRKDSSCRGGTCCQHPTRAWLPGQGWCSHSAGPSVSHRLVLTWRDAKPYGLQDLQTENRKDRVAPGKESIQKRTPRKSYAVHYPGYKETHVYSITPQHRRRCSNIYTKSSISEEATY